MSKPSVSDSSAEGPTTPTARQGEINLIDRPQVEDTMTSISDTLAKLDTSVNELNEQSSQVDNLGPTSHEIEEQLQNLRRDVNKHGKQQKSQFESVKKWIKEDAKDRILSELTPDIKSNIEAEVKSRVKEEVDLQIKDLVPVSLEQQLEETEKQLQDVKISLQNSESRRINNTLDMSLIQDEPLEPILRTDGTKSELYPADLISLLCYDSETMKQLLKDYDLPVDDALEANFNRFMAHIGIKHQLLSSAIHGTLPPPSPPPSTAVV